MDRPASGPLLDHFSALEASRQQAKLLHPPPEIIILLLCGTLAGADDFVEIALWGGEHPAFLRRFLPCRHGIPGHDTLGEVVASPGSKHELRPMGWLARKFALAAPVRIASSWQEGSCR